MFGVLTRRACPLPSNRLSGCLLQLRHVSSTSAGAADYTCIKVAVEQGVGTITIARPKQLNALNSQVCRCTQIRAPWIR